MDTSKDLLAYSSLRSTSQGQGLLSWDELCELVFGMEVSLNHRPLSYVEDNSQFPTLAPNSLLFLNANILPELEPHRL